MFRAHVLDFTVDVGSMIRRGYVADRTASIARMPFAVQKRLFNKRSSKWNIAAGRRVAGVLLGSCHFITCCRVN